MKYSNSALEKEKQYKTLAQQKEGNYKGKTEINTQKTEQQNLKVNPSSANTFMSLMRYTTNYPNKKEGN